MKVTLYRFAYLGILVTSFDILLQKVYANQCIYRLDFFHNHTPYSCMECGCGRSPTGKCIGWHKLSEEEYQKKLQEYQDKQNDKE